MSTILELDLKLLVSCLSCHVTPSSSFLFMLLCKRGTLCCVCCANGLRQIRDNRTHTLRAFTLFSAQLTSLAHIYSTHWQASSLENLKIYAGAKHSLHQLRKKRHIGQKCKVHQRRWRLLTCCPQRPLSLRTVPQA